MSTFRKNIRSGVCTNFRVTYIERAYAFVCVFDIWRVSCQTSKRIHPKLAHRSTFGESPNQYRTGTTYVFHARPRHMHGTKRLAGRSPDCCRPGEIHGYDALVCSWLDTPTSIWWCRHMSPRDTIVEESAASVLPKWKRKKLMFSDQLLAGSSSSMQRLVHILRRKTSTKWPIPSWLLLKGGFYICPLCGT